MDCEEKMALSVQDTSGERLALDGDPVEASRKQRECDKVDFKRMNLPEEFWTARFQEIPDSGKYKVQKYFQCFGQTFGKGIGFLIHGSAGVGKTALASVMAKEIRKRGRSVYYTPIWELRELIRNRDVFDDETTYMDRCREVDFLILDNLKIDDAEEGYLGSRVLEDLICSRKARHRPTIVISRHSPRELSSKMSSFMNAIYGTLHPFHLVGENKKKQQHERLVNFFSSDSSKVETENKVKTEDKEKIVNKVKVVKMKVEKIEEKSVFMTDSFQSQPECVPQIDSAVQLEIDKGIKARKIHPSDVERFQALTADDVAAYVELAPLIDVPTVPITTSSVHSKSASKKHPF